MTSLVIDLRLPGDRLGVESWTPRTLKGGEILWEEGAPADTLVWVVTGALHIRVGDQIVGQVEAGELLGEVSILAEDARRAGLVQALRPTEVRVLSRERLLSQRAQGAETYDVVLAAALDALVERIAGMSAKVSAGWGVIERMPDPRIQTGQAFEAMAAPSFVDTMARVPGFARLSPDMMAALVQVSPMTQVATGTALYRKGEPGRSCFLIAGGSVVLEGGESSTFGASSLLEAGALVREQPRGATALVSQSAWVFELSQDHLRQLSRGARREVFEAVLIALRDRLLSANVLLRRASGPKGNLTGEEAFGTLEPVRDWRQQAPQYDIALEMMPVPEPVLPSDSARTALFEHIRDSILGQHEAMWTAFGLRRVTYADYTASGRSLTFIEDFIRSEVMPLYANTHTEASASGLQTTHYREEAREIIARCVGATKDDAVVFVGSGATGAINRLVDMLNIRLPVGLDEQYDLASKIPPEERPVVFIGPYEHHSNILPWRHSLADLCIIPLDHEGQLSTTALEEMLLAFADRPLKIGSFSAASNVTGQLTDTVGISTLLHRHGALSFWDFAAAGPYMDVDMNPTGEGIDASLAYMDAAFFSPHKFIGGPGTPGLLVVKRALDKTFIPTNPGGGTVDFVTSNNLKIKPLYGDSLEQREEPGTPAIIESIRCGLVFQLKDQVGPHTIHEVEAGFMRSAIDSWLANPGIRVLGNPAAERLSITSFMVRHGHSGYLHHNFIIAVLNDLFGIQARGGCSCAGPYGSMLLGIHEARGRIFLECVDEGWASLKPGWARVNFNYFISQREFRYIVAAVHAIALKGWALMPDYSFDPHSGIWTHKDAVELEIQSLDALQWSGRRMDWESQRHTLLESALDRHLAEGLEVMEEAARAVPPVLEPPNVPEVFEAHRWFPLPHEIAAYLRERNLIGES